MAVFCRTEDQSSATVCPVGTGSSRASNVIAMATTASENAISRSVARDSDPRSVIGH